FFLLNFFFSRPTPPPGPPLRWRARRRTRFEMGREVIDQKLFLRVTHDRAPADHLLNFTRPALTRQTLRDDQVGLVAIEAFVTRKLSAFAFRQVLPGRAGVRPHKTAAGS